MVTVKDLKAFIKDLPDDLVVGSCGPDSGGYDVADGVKIELKVMTNFTYYDWDRGGVETRIPALYIGHNGYDDV